MDLVAVVVVVVVVVDSMMMVVVVDGAIEYFQKSTNFLGSIGVCS